MPLATRHYRLRIRSADDTSDALILSSVPGGTNPYLTGLPQGDGQEIDPATGESSIGAYTIEAADVSEIITAALVDGSGRQALIQRRAYIELSTDAGSSWPTVLLPGFINGYRLVTPMRWAFTVGESRRIEYTRQVWDHVTEKFEQATCLIGGPVRGEWGPTVDYGGWCFRVTASDAGTVTLRPNLADLPIDEDTEHVQLTGSNDDDILIALTPFVRNRANQFAAADQALVETAADEDTYPGIVVLVQELDGTEVDYFTPRVQKDDNKHVLLTRADEIVLLRTGTAWAVTPPDVDVIFRLYVWRTTVDEDTPLHIDAHPVDILTDLWDEAGMAYDSTEATTVRGLIGDNTRLMLRIEESWKLGDVQKMIGGLFGINTRVGTDGELEVITTRIRGITEPASLYDDDDLRSADTVIFDVDEESIYNTVTVEEQRFVPWKSGMGDQPIDKVVARSHIRSRDLKSGGATPDSETFGVRELRFKVPGSVKIDVSGPGLGDDEFVHALAIEVFDRFGRGGVYATVAALPTITEKVGEELRLDVSHLPNAGARGGERILQVVRRTETPSGPELLLLDSGPNSQFGTAPTFSIAAGAADARRFVDITITNAAALNAAGASLRVQWAAAASEPSSGSVLFEYGTGVIPSTPTVLRVDAGSHIWIRMQAFIPEGRPTAYTAWQDVDLTDLTAPSSLSDSAGSDPARITITFTPGESDIPLEVLQRPQGDPADEARVVDNLSEGSDRVTLTLVPGNSYTIGIRHREQRPFNGVSSITEISFTVAGSPDTLSAPTQPFALGAKWTPGSLDGSSGVEPGDWPGDVTDQYAVGLRVRSAIDEGFIEFDMATETAVESGTPGTYSTEETRSVAGLDETYVFMIDVPLDGKLRYMRARHVRVGATASSYTSVVSILPGEILSPAPPVDPLDLTGTVPLSMGGSGHDYGSFGEGSLWIGETGGADTDELIAPFASGDGHYRLNCQISGTGTVALLSWTAADVVEAHSLGGASHTGELPIADLGGEVPGGLIRVDVAGTEWEVYNGGSAGDFLMLTGGGAEDVWAARTLIAADIPALDYAASSHNHDASHITSGALALARGGLGADFSAIGEGSLFIGETEGTALDELIAPFASGDGHYRLNCQISGTGTVALLSWTDAGETAAHALGGASHTGELPIADLGGEVPGGLIRVDVAGTEWEVYNGGSPGDFLMLTTGGAEDVWAAHTLTAADVTSGAFPGSYTIAGTLEVTGLITATGGVKIASSVGLFRGNAIDALRVGGGTSALLGGQFILYGESHASQAGDIALKSSNVTKALFDLSDNRWEFLRPVQITGTLVASGLASLNGSLSVYDHIKSTVANRYVIFSGGSTTSLGGSIVCYGESHASADDISFRHDTAVKLLYDASDGRWEFKIPTLMESTLGVTGTLTGAAATFSGTLGVTGVVTQGTSRPITLGATGGWIAIKGGAGGWTTGTTFLGSASTDLGGFGTKGVDDALDYFYVGTHTAELTKWASSMMTVLTAANFDAAVTMDTTLGVTGTLSGAAATFSGTLGVGGATTITYTHDGVNPLLYLQNLSDAVTTLHEVEILAKMADTGGVSRNAGSIVWSKKQQWTDGTTALVDSFLSLYTVNNNTDKKVLEFTESGAASFYSDINITGSIQAEYIGVGGISGSVGLLFAGNIAAGASQRGIRFQNTFDATADCWAIDISPTWAAVSGTNYGLYIANVVNGVTGNCSLYTNSGLVRLGDAVTMTSTLNVAGAATFSSDVTIGSLGIFDSSDTPTDRQFLLYNDSISKWQAEDVQLAWGNSDVKAAVLADNTAVAYILEDPGAGADSPVGAPSAPSAPTLYGAHESITLEVVGYSRPADFRYFEWRYSEDDFASDDHALATTTSDKIVHARLDNTTTYYYKVRATDRAANSSSYSSVSNTTPVANGSQAFGVILAAEIGVANLAAIQANIGIITAGQMRDSTNVYGINLGGAGGIPGTWNAGVNFENTAVDTMDRYVNFYEGASDGLDSFIKHEKFDLKHDGTALFSGVARDADSEVVVDFPNKLIRINDGTYDRVKLGLIGSYYGIQFKDSAGVITLDTANSDGRLKLQIGKSDTQAPVVLLIHQNKGLSTTSTSETSIDSLTLPADALAVDGDIIRVKLMGRADGAATKNVYVDLGSTEIFNASLVGGGLWIVDLYITRTGSAAQDVRAAYVDGPSTNAMVFSAATEDGTGDLTIDFRGKTGNGAEPLYVDLITVEYLGV